MNNCCKDGKRKDQQKKLKFFRIPQKPVDDHLFFFFIFLFNAQFFLAKVYCPFFFLALLALRINKKI